jgi:hypothetical protein
VAIESTAEQFNLQVVYSNGTATENITRAPGTDVSIPVKVNTGAARTVTIKHKETGDVLYTVTQAVVGLQLMTWTGTNSDNGYYFYSTSSSNKTTAPLPPGNVLADFVNATNSNAWNAPMSILYRTDDGGFALSSVTEPFVLLPAVAATYTSPKNSVMYYVTQSGVIGSLLYYSIDTDLESLNGIISTTK